MSDTPSLTVNEEKVAKAYGSSGKWPKDPHDRRILDYLITSGQVGEKKTAEEAKPKAAAEREQEQPGGADDAEPAAAE